MSQAIEVDASNKLGDKFVKRCPLVIFYDQSLSELEKKGEIEASYFDPLDRHSRFIFINTGDCQLTSASEERLFGGKGVEYFRLTSGMNALTVSFFYSSLGLRFHAKKILKKIHLQADKAVVVRCYGLGFHTLAAHALSVELLSPIIVSLHNMPFQNGIRTGIRGRVQEFLQFSKLVKVLKKVSATIYVYRVIENFLSAHSIENGIMIRNIVHQPLKEKAETQNSGPPQITSEDTRVVSLIFVGRVISGKNPDIAIRCLLELPSYFHLTIIGDGPMLAEMKALVSDKELEKRVTFLGSVPNSEVRTSLERSDLFVGYSEYQEFPKTYIEAQAAGLPIIVNRMATNVSEIIDSCCLVEPTPSAFAREILTIVSSSESYENHSNRSLDFYNTNYSAGPELKKLEDLYAKLFD